MYAKPAGKQSGNGGVIGVRSPVHLGLYFEDLTGFDRHRDRVVGPCLVVQDLTSSALHFHHPGVWL